MKMGNNGALLIEVLLVIVVLSVALTLIIESMTSSLRATVFSADYSLGALLAENKMTELCLQKSGSQDLSPEGDFSAPAEQFHYQVKTEPYLLGQKDTDEKPMSVAELEISWPAGKNRREIEVARLFPRSTQGPN